MFTINKKVTAVQLNALIAYIEGKLPGFNRLRVYRRGRKAFEEIYNVGGYQDLLSYIQNAILSNPTIRLKLQW